MPQNTATNRGTNVFAETKLTVRDAEQMIAGILARLEQDAQVRVTEIGIVETPVQSAGEPFPRKYRRVAISGYAEESWGGGIYSTRT